MYLYLYLFLYIRICLFSFMYFFCKDLNLKSPKNKIAIYISTEPPPTGAGWLGDRTEQRGPSARASVRLSAAEAASFKTHLQRWMLKDKGGLFHAITLSLIMCVISTTFIWKCDCINTQYCPGRVFKAPLLLIWHSLLQGTKYAPRLFECLWCSFQQV